MFQIFGKILFANGFLQRSDDLQESPGCGGERESEEEAHHSKQKGEWIIRSFPKHGLMCVGVQAGIKFPAGRFVRKMCIGRYAKRVSRGSGVYLGAVIGEWSFAWFLTTSSSRLGHFRVPHRGNPGALWECCSRQQEEAHQPSPHSAGSEER